MSMRLTADDEPTASDVVTTSNSAADRIATNMTETAEGAR